MSEMKHTPGQNVEYQSHSGTFDAPALLPCPCCGEMPEIRFIGNDYTKTRKVIIKCKACRLERTNGGITKSSEWVARISIDQWNKRPVLDAAAPEMVELLERLSNAVRATREASEHRIISASMAAALADTKKLLSKIKNQTDEPND